MIDEAISKPDRFGDGETIYIRQFRVNVTRDMRTVSGHVTLVEMEKWIPAIGVVRAVMEVKSAPSGLELIDQTAPIGSSFTEPPSN